MRRRDISQTCQRTNPTHAPTHNIVHKEQLQQPQHQPNSRMNHPCASTARGTRSTPLRPRPRSHQTHLIIVILEILFIVFGVYESNLCEYDCICDTNNVLLCKTRYEFYVNCENFIDLRNAHGLHMHATSNTTSEPRVSSYSTPCLSGDLRVFYIAYDIFDNKALNDTSQLGM